MSTDQKLANWKERCTKEEVISWFTEKDHYKVGLDNGCSIIQIMHDIGFRNPSNDHIFETMAKMHLRSMVHQARSYFYRDGFIMSSKKFKTGTPTVYFLIDNYSEERIQRHYKLKSRAERGVHKFRNDKLEVLQLSDKVKEPKLKESFKRAYSTKLDLNQSLLPTPKRKKELK